MLGRRVLTFLAIVGGFFYLGNHAVASHGAGLVISEVQITGGAGKTTNDFIELYNPTGSAVDLNGVRLVKRTATGTSDTTLKSWTESTLIPAHGFYLWANNDFDTIGANPDAKTSGSLADNNGAALRRGAEDTGEIIDAVAWGTASNAFVEGSVFFQNPGAGQSMERKPGGTEGNGTDSGNNASDFILQSTPNPKNSASASVPTLPISGGSTSDPTEDEPLPIITAGDVLINEFVPDPTDTIEWIELYNKTGAVINLAGWKLSDGTGSTIKSLSGTISAQGFLSFDLTSARLNNSGDNITLKSSSGAIIDAVSYGDWSDGNTQDNAPAPTKGGQSVARSSNGLDTGNDKNDFSLSDLPTKNTSNVITVNTTISVGGTNITQVPFTPKLQILINELVADPEDGPEWVEIYNAGNLSVDLEGWYLEDGSEQKTKLSGTIIPEQFIVVQNIEGNLNNAGDIVRLKNQKGEMTDRVTFGAWEDGTPSDNAPFAADPNSIARRVDGKDTDNDKEDFVVSAKPTKGKGNVIEEVQKENGHPEHGEGSLANASNADKLRDSSPLKADQNDNTVDLAGKLFISEFIPDPEGSDEEEWIELYWDGEAELDLAGFKLDDKEGGSSAYTIKEVKAAPHSYVLFLKAKTRLTLNNTSDEVRLLDPKGEVIDSIEYEEVKKGQAYALGEERQWGWTAKPTPGQENVIEIENLELIIENGDGDKTKEIEISDVRDLELGSKVRVQGIVSAPPGILGAQVFYLHGSGIQVYSSKKAFPAVQVGDVVEVQGVLGQASGEHRIRIKDKEDIKVIKKGKAPSPHEISSDEIGDETEAALVKVKGTIVDVKKSGFTLDDGLAEIYVAVKTTTGIEINKFAPGFKVAVIGIVGQTKSGYQLMPRFSEDIEILGKEELDDAVVSEEKKEAGASGEHSPYTKATAAGGGAVAAAAVIRRRKLLISGARAVAFLIKRSRNNLG